MKRRLLYFLSPILVLLSLLSVFPLGATASADLVTNPNTLSNMASTWCKQHQYSSETFCNAPYLAGYAIEKYPSKVASYQKTVCKSADSNSRSICNDAFTAGLDQAKSDAGQGSTTTQSAGNQYCESQYSGDQTRITGCETIYSHVLSTSNNDSVTYCVKPSDGISTAECNVIYQAALQNKPGGDTTATNPTTTDSSTSPTCDPNGTLSFSWAFCPIINALAGASDDIYQNVIGPFLFQKPLTLNSSDPTFRTWENFRIYGDIILVITLLVVVFGESIGGGLIDAYSAKKILPRLLAAAVLINLSIYIVSIGIDITNIIGSGIVNLIEAPFKGAGNFSLKINGSTGDIGTLGIAGLVLLIWKAKVAAELAEFLLLFTLIPALLILIAILVTVIFRRGLILLLVISAPIAFALYCLPNTEKYFRQWWDLLSRTLLVYPIIAAMFALANVLSVTIDNSSTGASKTAADFVAIITLFVPLALIPYSFRIAGGLIGRFHEFAHNTGKRSSEAIKGNPNDPWSWRNRSKLKVGAGLGRYQQHLIDRGEDMTNGKAPFRRRLVGGIAGSGLFGNADYRSSKYNKLFNEVEENMSATGRDDLRYAAAGYEKDGKFYNSKGKEISGNQYRRAKSFFGFTPHGIGSSLEYTLRKAQTPEDVAAFRESFRQNAIENNWTGKEMKDVWAQATYPHKDKYLSEWHSTPVPTDGVNARSGVMFEDVSNNSESFDKVLNESYRTVEQFRKGSTRVEDWQARYGRFTDIQSRLEQDRHSGTNTVSDEDKGRFVKMNEELDGLVHENIVTRDGEGNVSVSGGNTETQRVVRAMFDSRRLKTTHAPVERILPDGSTQYEASPNDAVIYHPDDIAGATGSSDREKLARNPDKIIGGVVKGIANTREPIENAS